MSLSIHWIESLREKKRRESSLSPLQVKSLAMHFKIQRICNKNVLIPTRGEVSGFLETQETKLAAKTVMQQHVKLAAALEKHI